jgi:hypothetical protein
MNVRGAFEVTMNPEPPYDVVDGVTLSHVTIQKRFEGPLEATSQVHMIGARTAVEGSAGYVAIERVTGTLDGKRGTFVLQHNGIMTRGARSLTVTVVPDSGTGELVGLSGGMDIRIVEGKHFYDFEYALLGSSRPVRRAFRRTLDHELRDEARRVVGGARAHDAGDDHPAEALLGGAIPAAEPAQRERNRVDPADVLGAAIDDAGVVVSQQHAARARVERDAALVDHRRFERAHRDVMPHRDGRVESERQLVHVVADGTRRASSTGARSPIV